MDIYLSLFVVGAAGLTLMAALGAVGGHGAHGHAHGSPALRHSPASHAATAHGHTHHALPAPGRVNLRAALLGWLSPRVLLTLAMGAGATGVLLANVLPTEPLRAFASLGGAVALEKLVVAPLWKVLTGFASKPARTLDSAVLEEATALAHFDAQGYGLVAINLDGHEMRLLARLSPEHAGAAVRTGEKLLVESVDGARGRCVVSPIGKPV